MEKAKKIGDHLLFGVIMIIVSLVWAANTPHQKNNPYQGFIESCG